MFGSKFSLYECLKFNVHWSSLPMSRIRNSAAAAVSCLDRNSGAVGLRGVASFDLSHNNSRGYKCCMALSRTVFWVRTLAARTTPSRPAISFSMILSGQQFRFHSSDFNISTSHTDRGFCEFPYFRRCRSSSARWYSEDQRRQIASLLLWRNSLVSWGPFLSDDTTTVLAKCWTWWTTGRSASAWVAVCHLCNWGGSCSVLSQCPGGPQWARPRIVDLVPLSCRRHPS